MSRKVHRKDIEDDIQGTIRIEVEISNETDDSFPCRFSTRMHGFLGLYGVASCRGMARSKTAGEFSSKFGIAL